MYFPISMLQDAEQIEGQPVWVELYADGSGYIKTRYPANDVRVLVVFLPYEYEGQTYEPVGVNEGLSYLYHINRGLKWERNE